MRRGQRPALPPGAGSPRSGSGLEGSEGLCGQDAGARIPTLLIGDLGKISQLL